MATRLARIELSSVALANYLQTALHFVRKDGAVFLGELIAVDVDFLKVKNTRGKIQSLHLRELDEIWADKPA